jgi:hypothetical protein
MGRKIAPSTGVLTMKIALFATATAAVALLGGAAYAQDPAPKAPTPGSAPAPAEATPSETVAAPPVDTGVTTSTETTTTPNTTTSTDATTSTDTTAATDVAAPASAQAASVTTMTVTNGPVADTPENRAKYGPPMSRAGKRTAAKGN